VLPAADGFVVVWRGPRDGGVGQTAVVLGPRGEPRGEPIEIGSAYCATARGLAWIEREAGSPAQIRARAWSDLSIADVVAVPRDRDPSLVCGDRAVVVLGDGDEDLTATAFVPGEGAALAPAVVIRDADFGEDEEREHEPYAMGDDLGILRVGGSGAVALRELPLGGLPKPWRRIRHTLSDDDDVVSVDADADATFVVYTHETEEDCPGLGSAQASIRALRIERRTGAESRLELSPPSCEPLPGPFWVAPAPGAPVVAWVERVAKVAPKAAPIAGVELRTVSGGSVRATRIEQAADAIADAGCDDRGCSVAALVREPDSDGMRPAPIRVLPYP
jgi:hypothetical protein